MINLISDTVTKPTSEMLKYMMMAEVGDDVFQSDPSVNRLQTFAADLFNMEAALFVPSGTMSNQIAIKCHTQPMDELICDVTSHVYQYENGGYALHSGVAIQLLHGQEGKLTPEDIKSAYRQDQDWLPHSQLVVLENSINKAGGNIYTLREMQAISSTCKQLGLKLHLDGARIFNVLVETGDSPQALGPLFDSISVCLSKGLGAPVGSLLLSTHTLIKKARKWRKALGGGMRQSGYLAAAGLYALQNHISQLKLDNKKARRLGQCLSHCEWVSEVLPVHTNIVIFRVKDHLTSEQVVQTLRLHHIGSSAFGPQSVRFVTHLDVSESEITHVMETLVSLRSKDFNL